MASCMLEVVIVCGLLLSHSIHVTTTTTTRSQEDQEIFTTVIPSPSVTLKSQTPQPLTLHEEQEAGTITIQEEEERKENITQDSENESKLNTTGKNEPKSAETLFDKPRQNLTIGKEIKTTAKNEPKSAETLLDKPRQNLAIEKDIKKSSNKGKVIGSKETLKKRVENVPEQLPVALAQTADGETKGYMRSDETYIIEDTAKMPCVMAYFKAHLTIYYPTDPEKQKYKSTAVSPPSDVTVSGKCDRDSLIADLFLTWEQGRLALRFAFEDLTDSWFVDRFTFTFNTSMSAYRDAGIVEQVVLKSPEKKRYWQTSHARSFRCLLLHDVNLMNDDEDYSATIHFDEARVQALTKTTTFKTPKHCIHRVHRDEMVPVTVGGSLVGLTVLTVAGYGIFRYFKVKKFEYGTME